MESGIYVLAGAFIGGLFSYLSAQRGAYVSRLEKDLSRQKVISNELCQQIKAYYNLERRYVAEVATMMNQPEKTVQIRFRDDIETEIGIRPTWTSRDAENAISKLA